MKPIEDLAQALRSIGEPIFGQAVKDISGGKLLKQLFCGPIKCNKDNSYAEFLINI